VKTRVSKTISVEWSILHNKELCDLYRSSGVVRVVKSNCNGVNKKCIQNIDGKISYKAATWRQRRQIAGKYIVRM
jgi:hypothetical protein